MKASICHICGRLAKNACGSCGRPVCDADYDSISGICRSCKAGRKLPIRSKLS